MAESGTKCGEYLQRPTIGWWASPTTREYSETTWLEQQGADW